MLLYLIKFTCLEIRDLNILISNTDFFLPQSIALHWKDYFSSINTNKEAEQSLVNSTSVDSSSKLFRNSNSFPQWGIFLCQNSMHNYFRFGFSHVDINFCLFSEFLFLNIIECIHLIQ